MTKVKIWHNPRCSKSRATLEILQDSGADIEVVRYKETPPDAAEIRQALDLLGLSARDLVRKGEAAFKALGLKDADENTLVAAMAEHPDLIERPVVFANGKAAIGRPPESVKTIL